MSVGPRKMFHIGAQGPRILLETSSETKAGGDVPVIEDGVWLAMASQVSHTIHNTGIWKPTRMVDFYGFHEGKYICPMDSMGLRISN